MLFHPTVSGYIDIAAVDHWYSSCQKSLDVMARAYANWMAAGAIGVPPISLPASVTSSDEVSKHFTNLSNELELAGILWLVTALEGRFRVDLRSRLRMKDFLAVRLTKLRDERGEEFLVPFEAGILEAWKEFLRNAGVQQSLQDVCVNGYGQIKPLIKLRHWLAHGRYWDAKINVEAFDIASARNAIDALFKNFSQAALQVRIPAIP